MPRSPPSNAPPASSPTFNSHPTDVVLVNTILRPWVARGVRPPGAVAHAADLYAAAPSDLARRYRAAVDCNGERVWYFLSPLRTKSPRGRRKARTVAGGAGWWHGEAGPKPVVDPLDGRRKVGYRQSFSFMRRGEDAVPVRTGWIMVELRLHYDNDEDDGGGGVGEQLEDLVLCKVYRSPRHPDTAAAAHDDDDAQEESCAATATAPAGSSDAPPLVTAVESPGGKTKVDDDEGSSTATAAAASPRHHIKNSDDETSGDAAVPSTPGPKEKAAATPVARGDEEEKKAMADENDNSSATTAVARGSDEGKKADDDEDSSASTPATRKRARMADDKATGAASVHKKMAAGNPASPATQHLHCPQCGFHIGALHIRDGDGEGDCSGRRATRSWNGRCFRFREGSFVPSFLLRFRDPKQA